MKKEIRNKIKQRSELEVGRVNNDNEVVKSNLAVVPCRHSQSRRNHQYRHSDDRSACASPSILEQWLWPIARRFDWQHQRDAMFVGRLVRGSSLLMVPMVSSLWYGLA
jgi:hypothetical protein